MKYIGYDRNLVCYCCAVGLLCYSCLQSFLISAVGSSKIDDYCNVVRTYIVFSRASRMKRVALRRIASKIASRRIETRRVASSCATVALKRN